MFVLFRIRISCAAELSIKLSFITSGPDLTKIFQRGHKGTNPLLASPGPEVIKHCPCFTQQSMNFFLLINVKMPTAVGILTVRSRKNSILGSSGPEKLIS